MWHLDPSLPLWERGLKFYLTGLHFPWVTHVAPLVGAWIEIDHLVDINKMVLVAPLVGAWIEICHLRRRFSYRRVAPLVGAWIEI